jgi:hypothetical protein
MLFVSIIWNYFVTVPLGLCQYINKFSPIQRIIVLDVGSQLSQFVTDIYSCNTIKKEYVDRKIVDLKTLNSTTVMVLIHKISNPQIQFDQSLNKYYCSEIKNLKSQVRNRYNSKFNCLEKAPIIHSTDNDVETKKLLSILNRYFNSEIMTEIPLLKLNK